MHFMSFILFLSNKRWFRLSHLMLRNMHLLVYSIRGIQIVDLPTLLSFLVQTQRLTFVSLIVHF